MMVPSVRGDCQHDPLSLCANITDMPFLGRRSIHYGYVPAIYKCYLLVVVKKKKLKSFALCTKVPPYGAYCRPCDGLLTHWISFDPAVSHVYTYSRQQILETPFGDMGCYPWRNSRPSNGAFVGHVSLWILLDVCIHSHSRYSILFRLCGYRSSTTKGRRHHKATQVQSHGPRGSVETLSGAIDSACSLLGDRCNFLFHCIAQNRRFL
mmetsp:Transcript_28029/g.42407  ORF Transcript_28029/g.42407 Transcript_28029/m.42407 type:complete len:208 (-) Transcript_28029:760-1383(-)